MCLVFKASNSDPDTLTFDEVMANITNCQGWLEAAMNETSALEAKGTWEEVDILEAESRSYPEHGSSAASAHQMVWSQS